MVERLLPETDVKTSSLSKSFRSQHKHEGTLDARCLAVRSRDIQGMRVSRNGLVHRTGKSYHIWTPSV